MTHPLSDYVHDLSDYVHAYVESNTLFTAT